MVLFPSSKPRQLFTFRLQDPPIRVVTDVETWENLGKDCREGQQHFAFYPITRDGDVHWHRSANGDALEECDVGIPVDELMQMARQGAPANTPGSRLDGTISLSILDRVPVEIFDHIIDHIPYSHLPVAALVARSWYASVVHNLYRILEIGSSEEYMSFATRLHASPRVQRWAMGTEEIIIGQPFCQSKLDSQTYLDSLPAALAPWLPFLRKLTIQSGLRSWMHKCFYAGIRRFPHLVSLRLTDAELDSLVSLQKVVHSFPLLKSLSLARIQIADKLPAARPLASVLAVRCSSIRLKILTLEFVEGKSLQQIVDWLVASAMCIQLEEFAVGLKGFVRQPAGDTTSPEGGQIVRILKESGATLKSFREKNDPAHGLGFPHCSLENNIDLRYLELHTYVSLDVDADVPMWKSLNIRPALVLPAQFGLAEKWAAGAREVRTDLMTVRSHQLEHLVIHLNIMLFDLYLKQNVSAYMDMIATKMRAKPRPHDIMGRPFFDNLRRVDVILDMRHDQLPHKLCVQWTPISVDPVVRELFRPWCERGIVKVSRFFRLNE